MKPFLFFGVLALTVGLSLPACAPPKKVISGYAFPKAPPAQEKTPAASGTAEEIRRMEVLIRQLEETEKRLRATQRQNEETLRRIEEASHKTEKSVERIQKAQDKIEAVGSKQVP
jgi:dsDNA-specific endonuclease/ATPase MutS2